MSATETSQRPVTVVADSTLDIPDDMAERLGIGVVPLDIHFGDETLRDHLDITSSAFLERLVSSPVLPTTSQPPPDRFAAVFRDAIAAGHDVLCVTISAGLSGTFNSAMLAAGECEPGRVRVLDSTLVAIPGGYVAVTAAEAARDGADLAECMAVATSVLGRSRYYAALDTLEYLHRGGRIGRARMLVGSLLSIKPIVTMQDGVIQPVERVRTWRKAMERLGDLAAEQRRGGIERMAVMHTGNPDDAERLAERLRGIAPGIPITFGELGPVVTTYAGPGLVGCCVVTAE